MLRTGGKPQSAADNFFKLLADKKGVKALKDEFERLEKEKARIQELAKQHNDYVDAEQKIRELKDLVETAKKKAESIIFDAERKCVVRENNVAMREQKLEEREAAFDKFRSQRQGELDRGKAALDSARKDLSESSKKLEGKLKEAEKAVKSADEIQTKYFDLHSALQDKLKRMEAILNE